MLPISPEPRNIYNLKYRHINARTNTGTFDHVVIEKIISPNVNGESDISCQLYHTYIHPRKECCEFINMLTQFLAIFLGIYFLVQIVFPREKLTLNVGCYFQIY